MAVFRRFWAALRRLKAALTGFDAFKPNQRELERARVIMAACRTTPGQRSLDDERVFMEKLLLQRLHFLLVVFSIFVGVGFAARSYWLAMIVFCAGSVICFLMAEIIYRAHIKHHWIMRLFYGKPDSALPEELPHVIKFINDAMTATDERKSLQGGSVSTWVGVGIPTACWCFLLVCFAVSAGLACKPYFRMAFAHSDATVTYTDANGNTVALQGHVTHTIHGSGVQVTVVDANDKTCVLLLPFDRFVSIQR